MSITPKSNPAGASPGIVIPMMVNQSALNTLSTVICPSPGCKNHTFTFRASAGITGAVQLETSPDPLYTGEWSPLGGGPIDVDTVSVNAGILELMFSNITFVAVRARISTVVAGGNLSVDYLGGR